MGGLCAVTSFVPVGANRTRSFTSDPTGGDADLRLTYCAFVICALLNDWSGVDVEKALGFVRRCRVSTPLPCFVCQLAYVALDL